MAVRAVKNQYRGLNAHLHSYWQAEGGWQDFHARHISDLAAALKARLLPMGYTATIEQSLQIRRAGETLGNPQADILIGDLDAARATELPTQHPAAAGILVMPTLAALAGTPISEKPFRAIAIYEFEPGKAKRGSPVAWIEVLSPSNKGESKDALAYREKRLDLLYSRLVFVEIDYLHETPPTLRHVRVYRPPKGQPFEAGAHPYRVVLIDPRPDLTRSETQVTEFDVDAPLPTLTIPLSRQDAISFDFDIAYQETFEKMLYGLELVDYSQLPLNFERYSPDDQARIARRMLAVWQAHDQGVDLEAAAPLPVEHIPLETALATLRQRL